MRQFVLLALCSGLTTVVAQTASGSSSTTESSSSTTETSPLLFSANGDGDSTDFSVAVAGSSGSTTTYLVSCAEAGSINCNFDTATIVGGPSTVAMYYNYDDTVTYSLGCNIHGGSAAACVVSEGGSGLDGTSFLSSFTIPASNVALGFITDATVTATAADAATSTATSQAATTTAASTGSSPTLATVKSTAAPSTVAPSAGTTSSTGSATGTGSAASQTETKKGAAVSRFNGATGSWVVVGSAVAALMLMF